MPPSIYEKLQNLLKEIFIPENIWPKIHRVAKCWADISMFNPPLESVETYLTFYAKIDTMRSEEESIASLRSLGLSGSMEEEMLRKKAEKDAQKKETIVTMVDRMVAGDPSLPQPDWLFKIVPKDDNC